jgi:hypothetical protein
LKSLGSIKAPDEIALSTSNMRGDGAGSELATGMEPATVSREVRAGSTESVETGGGGRIAAFGAAGADSVFISVPIDEDVEAFVVFTSRDSDGGAVADPETSFPGAGVAAVREELAGLFLALDPRGCAVFAEPVLIGDRVAGELLMGGEDGAPGPFEPFIFAVSAFVVAEPVEGEG